MKTFDEFITEARISKRQVIRKVGRQVKRLAKTPAARAVKRYVAATAGGAIAATALKLLTGL